MREVGVAELRAGDHVELGADGYDVREVEQHRGQVEVVDTVGSVHIYTRVAVVAIRGDR